MQPCGNVAHSGQHTGVAKLTGFTEPLLGQHCGVSLNGVRRRVHKAGGVAGTAQERVLVVGGRRWLGSERTARTEQEVARAATLSAIGADPPRPTTSGRGALVGVGAAECTRVLIERSLVGSGVVWRPHAVGGQATVAEPLHVAETRVGPVDIVAVRGGTASGRRAAVIRARQET